MDSSRIVRLATFVFLPLVVGVGAAACRDHSDTTTAPGAIANLTLDAPNSVHSGQSFDVVVRATAVGVNNVHNGHVDVMLPTPLVVSSVDASTGTSATFSNGSGASVGWNLGTLDSNSQSSLHVRATGTLAPGQPAQLLTIQATMTADGIRAGDAVAQHGIELTP
jgi:hypothetical protein